jgi:hypothetical protein
MGRSQKNILKRRITELFGGAVFVVDGVRREHGGRGEFRGERGVHSAS